MKFEKMKVGLLIGFIGLVYAILAHFVAVSNVFLAILVGLLFVIPILAIASGYCREDQDLHRLLYQLQYR